MLVPNSLGVKPNLVSRHIDLLENILEPSIALLENSVLCVHYYSGNFFGSASLKLLQ